jgi:hypothetical protein
MESDFRAGKVKCFVKLRPSMQAPSCERLISSCVVVLGGAHPIKRRESGRSEINTIGLAQSQICVRVQARSTRSRTLSCFDHAGCASHFPFLSHLVVCHCSLFPSTIIVLLRGLTRHHLNNGVPNRVNGNGLSHRQKKSERPTRNAPLSQQKLATSAQQSTHL